MWESGLEILNTTLPLPSTNVSYRLSSLIKDQKNYREYKMKGRVPNPKVLPKLIRWAEPTFRKRPSINHSKGSSTLSPIRETLFHQGEVERRPPAPPPRIEVVGVTQYLVVRMSRQIPEAPESWCYLHLPKRPKLASRRSQSPNPPNFLDL